MKTFKSSQSVWCTICAVPSALALVWAMWATLWPSVRVLAASSKAESALAAGQADVATRLLQAELKANPQDAHAELLLCRVDYSIELAGRAVDDCERAAALDRSDSTTQVWLGRAYGMKASRVNPFSAFGLAKRVRSAFEQAVALDPRSVVAMNDLGEFYIDAPGVVGGGLDKAAALAAKLQEVSPAAAARMLALVTEKKGNLTSAEAGFKQAVALSPTAEGWVDLGFFYQRHQRYDEMETALKQAVQLDRAHDAALVDVASILTSASRSPVQAKELLQQYLASPAKSEAAPAAKVHVQLGKLDEKAGDTAAAKQEYQAALGLAAAYAPAQKALEALR